MKTLNIKELEVKNAIDELIQTATSYNIDVLERIYHRDLNVIMVDTQNNVNTANKETFKGLFKAKKDAGDPPMSTWSKYHDVTVNGKEALVLLSRKNDLNGQNMELFLSIDLILEEERWQVKREVIFLRPDNDESSPLEESND